MNRIVQVYNTDKSVVAAVWHVTNIRQLFAHIYSCGHKQQLPSALQVFKKKVKTFLRASGVPFKLCTVYLCYALQRNGVKPTVYTLYC